MTVRIRGDEAEVDFTGSSPQSAGPLNSVLGYTHAGVYMTFQAATDPDISPNSGCYRPIRVIAPEGTIVNPRFPAACTGGNEVMPDHPQRGVPGARDDARRDGPHPRVMACDQGSSNNMLIAGIDPAQRRALRALRVPGGRLGRQRDRDGLSAVVLDRRQHVEHPGRGGRAPVPDPHRALRAASRQRRRRARTAAGSGSGATTACSGTRPSSRSSAIARSSRRGGSRAAARRPRRLPARRRTRPTAPGRAAAALQGHDDPARAGHARDAVHRRAAAAGAIRRGGIPSRVARDVRLGYVSRGGRRATSTGVALTHRSERRRRGTADCAETRVS